MEGVGGGGLRQLAFFGGSLSWHLGGHQAVARAGGLQVPGAEAARTASCLACSLFLTTSHLGAPEGPDAAVLMSATRGQPRHTDFCFPATPPPPPPPSPPAPLPRPDLSNLGWVREKPGPVHASDLPLSILNVWKAAVKRESSGVRLSAFEPRLQAKALSLYLSHL